MLDTGRRVEGHRSRPSGDCHLRVRRRRPALGRQRSEVVEGGSDNSISRATVDSDVIAAPPSLRFWIRGLRWPWDIPSGAVSPETYGLYR